MLTRWEYYCRAVSITLLSFLLYAHSLPESWLGRGAICKSSLDCDQTRFLECIDNNCDCRGSSGWSWVPEEQSCMIKEGSPCGGGRRGECVPNSSCMEGECLCDSPSYIRNGYGLCERSWGEPCSDKDGCSRRYSLECFKEDKFGHGTCKCQGEGETYVWDEERRKCVSKAGGPCDLNDPGYGRDALSECLRNSHCVPGTKGGGVCRCKPGFKQMENGDCFLEYGQQCQGNDPSGWQYCNKKEWLICREGKCDCQFFGQMSYDDEAQQCRLLVGESCSLSGNLSDPICVKDAFCKPRQGSTSMRGKCQCLQGFEVSPDQNICTKFKGHGRGCSAAMDCDRSRFMECVFGMAASDQGGKCKCLRNHMEWDGKHCRVQPGKSCLENPLCVEHSYCEGEWCVCSPGYKIAHSRCIKMIQEESATPFPRPTTLMERSLHWEPSPCDHFPERSLQWKECQCQSTPSTHIWMANESSCLALVGTKCQLDSHCVPHAICDPQQSVCQCSDTSAETTPTRQCSLSSSRFTSSSSSPPYKQLPLQHNEGGHNDHDHSHHPPQHFHDHPEMSTLKFVRLAEDDPSSSSAGIKIKIQSGVVASLLSSSFAVIISQYC